MNRKKKALGQGRDAYQCGVELCANPYLPIDGNPKKARRRVRMAVGMEPGACG